MQFVSKALIPSFFMLLCVTFAVLTYLLLDIRFGGGDVYPAYSSLRADPQGTKALYESLEGMETVEVKRNFDRWRRLMGTPKTIFFLGVNPEDDRAHETLDERVKVLAEEGSRIVIAYRGTKAWEELDSESSPDEASTLEREPSEGSSDDASTDTSGTEASDRRQALNREELSGNDNLFPIPKPQDHGDTEEQKSETPDINIVGDAEEMALDYRIYLHSERPAEEVEESGYVADGVQPSLGYPENIAWWSTSYFDDFGPEWQVHYRHLGDPVVLERTWGRGSILVLGDCYELSNQALWEYPETAYITWLIGPESEIVFNESHLGLTAQTNMMGLIRRFRLHGFLLGLLLVGALFVWKQASPLVPPLEEEKAGLPIGQQAASGLINLLNRGVPLGKLIDVCVRQWRDTLKVHQPHLAPREKQVDAVVEAAVNEGKPEKEVVDSFNQIQKIVSTRSSFR